MNGGIFGPGVTGVRVVAGEGAVEFVCADCDRSIISVGYHDGISICAVCRFIRTCPEMPDAMKAKLRGDDL